MPSIEATVESSALRARDDDVGRKPLVTIALAVLLFLGSRAYFLFGIDQALGSDMYGVYFKHAATVKDGHRAAYKEEKIEYPPLGWWLIYLAHTWDDRPITNQLELEQVYKSYNHAFRMQMSVFDFASFIVLFIFTWTVRRRFTGWALLTYTVTTGLMFNLLFDRLDIGMLFLLLTWALCWTRSLKEEGHPLLWSSASYFLLGLSISYKLIPVICVPFLLLSEWHVPRRWERIGIGLGCLVVAAGLPFAIQYAASGPDVFDLFKHHAERGIQLESIYSTIMMIGSLFGPWINPISTHGAYDLDGAWAVAMKYIASGTLLLFLAAMGLWALLRWSRYSRKEAFSTACFVMFGSVILSNVLSAQYFMWALTVGALLAIELFPNRLADRWILLVLFVIIAGLTTWIFPYNYFRSNVIPGYSHYGIVPANPAEGLGPSPVGCSILAARNILYLACVAWMGILLFRSAARISVGNLPQNRRPIPVRATTRL